MTLYSRTFTTSLTTNTTMKPIVYLLMFGMFGCMPLTMAQDEAEPATTEQPAAEENTEEAEPEVDEKALKKAANRYWSTKMAKKKKALSILKKVKDSKSSRKAARQLAKLFNLDGKKKEAPRPEDSEYMDAAERRFQNHIEKLDNAISEEVDRISELDNTAMGSFGGGSTDTVMSSELQKGIDAALK